MGHHHPQAPWGSRTATGRWEAELQAGCRAQTYPFSTAYHKRLEDDLSSDTSGHFKRILVSLALVRADLLLGTVPSLRQWGSVRTVAMEKTEHHLLAGQQCWTLSATPSLGVLPRDVLSQMSPPQLHDFCIDLQGNRDEGAANLTQAHEDAKVRTVLAELLEALSQKK